MDVLDQFKRQGYAERLQTHITSESIPSDGEDLVAFLYNQVIHTWWHALHSQYLHMLNFCYRMKYTISQRLATSSCQPYSYCFIARCFLCYASPFFVPLFSKPSSICVASSKAMYIHLWKYLLIQTLLICIGIFSTNKQPFLPRYGTLMLILVRLCWNYSDSKKWFNVCCFLIVCKVTQQQGQRRPNNKGRNISMTSGLYCDEGIM